MAKTLSPPQMHRTDMINPRIGKRLPVRGTAKADLSNWCYICGDRRLGSDPPYEEEHVIPKELFRPRTTSEFPAVLWVCREYHQQKTLDDQYFVRAMVMCTMQRNSSVEAKMDAELKALSKGHHLGLYRDILQRTHRKFVTGPAELAMPAELLTLPTERVTRFLTNIGKGLWQGTVVNRSSGTITRVERS